MQKCDGVSNCPNGEDEENCPTNENESQGLDEDEQSGEGEVVEPENNESDNEIGQDNPDSKIGDFLIFSTQNYKFF